MHIQLSEKFTTRKLLRFTMSSILMMVFISIYSVVDGLFVGRYVGSNGLAAVNIVFPLIMTIGSFGFMLGTGGTAEVARAMGEKRDQVANQYFSFLTLVTVLIGVFLSLLAFIFMEPLCYLMGASERIIGDSVTYGRICTLGTVFFMLQGFFQSFFVTAERPKMGFYLSILSGVINIFLDWLLVGVWGIGLPGAAIATVCGFMISGLIPIFYFFYKNTSRLQFATPVKDVSMLLRSMSNGASEMVTNISRSLITVLFNVRLMQLLGEDGVAAISVMLYIEFIFTAVLIGFSIGAAPVIGYHFGARNGDELKKLHQSCLKIVGMVSIVMFILSELAASVLVSIFIVSNPTLIELTVQGFRIFAISFLFCGINIFASAYFTALGNGRASAMISFIRTLFLQVIMILVLPQFLGIQGIWMALPVAEALTLGLTFWYFKQQQSVFKIRPTDR
ncbi:MATE family efflux transporter [Acetobacterium sp. K1/6]|uniref:MATE family efflux transporter n=1 Tax=Acetobacterium sp. K1/6 TaxID=3055467 RepID=UPI002ACA1ED1|nr:MATE family efflux transporter [Acetobacterium sp. K1/6]MDZ5723618.1 MATE family efflux transporter [Acetobacterium sp. K1/6]